MAKWQQTVVVLLIAVSCIGCDQATKAVVKSYLPRTEVLSFGGDTLRLQYAENPGAFLSLGSSLPERWRTIIFTGAVGMFLGLLLIYVVSVSTPPPTLLSLSLILGGSLSNLLDRIVYGGYVVDFINMGLGTLRTGIFNIADVAITSAVLFLVFRGLWHHRRSASN